MRRVGGRAGEEGGKGDTSTPSLEGSSERGSEGRVCG